MNLEDQVVIYKLSNGYVVSPPHPDETLFSVSSSTVHETFESLVEHLSIVLDECAFGASVSDRSSPLSTRRIPKVGL